jgi:hypothetical protein
VVCRDINKKDVVSWTDFCNIEKDDMWSTASMLVVGGLQV